MQEIKINIYEYEELSEKAKQKVLNYFRENNDYYFLEEYLKDILKDELKINNIIFKDNLKIYYSLNYCQGDGFCFIGNFEFKDYNIKITHNFRYFHKESTDITLYDNEGNENFEGYEEIEKEFKTIYYKICDICEKIGYNYIEAEDNEENIKKTIKANEYKFYENGEIFY